MPYTEIDTSELAFKVILSAAPNTMPVLSRTPPAAAMLRFSIVCLAALVSDAFTNLKTIASALEASLFTILTLTTANVLEGTV